MDAIRTTHERLVGDRFMNWYNLEHGTAFEFSGRGDIAPDLRYRSGDATLAVEVTEAFYDDADAKLKWQNMRNLPDAPRAWAGVEPEAALALEISKRIAAKAQNAYGPNCLLLVSVDPTVTSEPEMDRAIPTIAVPEKHAFAAIYVAGRFPCSRAAQDRYRCWQLC